MTRRVVESTPTRLLEIVLNIARFCGNTMILRLRDYKRHVAIRPLNHRRQLDVIAKDLIAGQPAG